MAEADRTLSGLFGLEPRGSPASGRDAPQSLAGEDLAASVIRQVPALRPFNVASGLGLELVRVLGVPLHEIATTAWNKRAEIRKFADAGKYPADQTNQVVLYDHDIKQTFHPTIEITAAGLPPGPKVVLTLLATLKLDGAILWIRAGRITHVQLGKLTAKGRLSYGEATLLEKERSWPLIPAIQLGEGLPVRGS